MYKAIVGSFSSPDAAQGAISRLREVGFPGDRMALVVRDPLGPGDTADATLPATGNRSVVVTAIVGGILGLLIGAAVGYAIGGATAPATGGGLATALLPDALIGLGVGLVAGGIAGFLVAFGARRAERRWRRVAGQRAETLLAVATDADNLPQARKLMAERHAVEVRGGGLSEADAFVLRATPVEADRYGAAPVGAETPPADVPAPRPVEQPPHEGEAAPPPSKVA